MPIHEYSCDRGHITEVFVPHDAVPPCCAHERMPDDKDPVGMLYDAMPFPCRGELHRIIGKTDFSLKGPRWEKDGYSGTGTQTGTGTTTTTRKK